MWGRKRKEKPDDPSEFQKRVIGLAEAGRRRTALDEVIQRLRHEPKDPALLDLALIIVSVSRTVNLQAAEPVTEAQWNSAILAPIVTECSSCHGRWYSRQGISAFSGSSFTVMNPVGMQCQKCRYTLCRDCLSGSRPASDGPVGTPRTISGNCRVPGHGPLGSPVIPTGRSDVTALVPDRIEAVIVTRGGPIRPTMDEALVVVTRFVPLIADDAPVIHIRGGRPGLMADERGRDELALAQIHDLEREGVLAPGAWNRSKRMFIEARDAPDTDYLVTVISKDSATAPHPLYGLHSGLSKEILVALAGKPEPSSITREESTGREHWLYVNAPSGLDTEIIISGGQVETAEMKSRDDGSPILRVDATSTFTSLVGYAVYALAYLLGFVPELDSSDIGQLIRKTPLTTRETIPMQDLVETAASLLETTYEDPRHTTFILVRRYEGIIIGSDAKRFCGFWRQTGDKIAFGVDEGDAGRHSYAGLTSAELIDLISGCRRSSRQSDTNVSRVLDELRREYGHPAYPFAASLERLAFGTAGPPLYQESMEPDEVDVIDQILARLATGSL